MSQKLADTLEEALRAGIVSGPQHERLSRLFAERGHIPANPGLVDAVLAAPGDDDFTPEEASEAPRFVRGFHDILITIGVVAALAGLWGLVPGLLGIDPGNPLSSGAVLAGVVLLSEILVRRQRLALPAFVLTGFFTVAGFVFFIPVIEGSLGDAGGLLIFLILPLLLTLYFLRYRVPVALATMLVLLIAFCFVMIHALFDVALSEAETRMPLVTLVTVVLAAFTLFGLAMAFDMSDPGRVTRRSDVAFWLHLAAAPALLFALSALILGQERGVWWIGEPDLREAIVAIGLVVLMMLIGIVIDRRGFVTAGLISLGVAVYVIASQIGFDYSSLGAFAVLAVGIIVLALGTGWRRLRGIILVALPQGLRKRLRPA